jgi:hypothetical protein
MLQRIGLITLLAVMTTACSVKVDRDTTGNVSPVGGVGFIKTFSIDSYAPTSRDKTAVSVDVLSQKKDNPDAVSFQVP